MDSTSEKLLDWFWESCGETEPFPRRLEHALALALPVALVKLPRLHLLAVEDWLRRRGIPFRFHSESRAVRGCLLAFGGKGWVFLDGSDPDDEQRFTLAHEIAHFLLDFWQPRRQAIERFGNGIVDVLDGSRPPEVSERVYALLAGIPIGMQVNLMERGVAAGQVWKIEDRADKMALALLAPPDQVLARVELDTTDFRLRLDETTQIVLEAFGLPRSVAPVYARALLEAIGKGPSWIEHFRRVSSPDPSWRSNHQDRRESNLPSADRNGK